MGIFRSGLITSGIFPGYGAGSVSIYFSGASTTWEVPSGLESVSFEAWGTGGAGGSWSDNAGGGGGGGYAKTTISNPTGGTVFTLTFGAAGIPSLATPGESTPTSVSAGTTVYTLAAGGKNGSNANSNAGLGASSGDCIGDIVYGGGKGGNGWNWNGGAGPGVEADYYSGPGGSGAGSTGPGENARNAAFRVNPGFATGTQEHGGDGGQARNAGDSAGYNGVIYGGAGGGASNFDSTGNHLGGYGAAGLIRITYTYPA